MPVPRLLDKLAQTQGDDDASARERSRAFMALTANLRRDRAGVLLAREKIAQGDALSS
jgi:hypothetical protein